MGLDAVELVMDVEDHFGITIQDSEAEGVRTVNDLVELIERRISNAHEPYCPTIPAFLKLRSTLRASIDDCSFRIRPRQVIAKRLTASQRRVFWKQLANLLGSAPRDLRRPQFLRRILGTITIVLISVALISAIAIDLLILPLTIAIAILIAVSLHVATIPCKTFPPDDWITFADVNAKLVGVTAATKQLSLQTSEKILAELRPLIVDALGVDIDEVVLIARFVEDLGID